MRKLLFFGVLFILVCVFGFGVLVSDAETQKTNNETEIETVEETTVESLDINDTMIEVEELDEPEVIVIENDESIIEEVEETEDIYEIKRQ